MGRALNLLTQEFHVEERLKFRRAHMTTNNSFKHYYANVKDVRLHYVTMGQGMPVVLLQAGHKRGMHGAWSCRSLRISAV
jgi:hypothetical protein